MRDSFSCSVTQSLVYFSCFTQSSGQLTSLHHTGHQPVKSMHVSRQVLVTPLSVENHFYLMFSYEFHKKILGHERTACDRHIRMVKSSAEFFTHLFICRAKIIWLDGRVFFNDFVNKRPLINITL